MWWRDKVEEHRHQAVADAYNAHFALHAKTLKFQEELMLAHLAEMQRVDNIKRLTYFGKEE